MCQRDLEIIPCSLLGRYPNRGSISASMMKESWYKLSLWVLANLASWLSLWLRGQFFQFWFDFQLPHSQFRSSVCYFLLSLKQFPFVLVMTNVSLLDGFLMTLQLMKLRERDHMGCEITIDLKSLMNYVFDTSSWEKLSQSSKTPQCFLPIKPPSITSPFNLNQNHDRHYYLWTNLSRFKIFIHLDQPPISITITTSIKSWHHCCPHLYEHRPIVRNPKFWFLRINSSIKKWDKIRENHSSRVSPSQ